MRADGIVGLSPQGGGLIDSLYRDGEIDSRTFSFKMSKFGEQSIMTIGGYNLSYGDN